MATSAKYFDGTDTKQKSIVNAHIQQTVLLVFMIKKLNSVILSSGNESCYMRGMANVVDGVAMVTGNRAVGLGSASIPREDHVLWFSLLTHQNCMGRVYVCYSEEKE